MRCVESAQHFDLAGNATQMLLDLRIANGVAWAAMGVWQIETDDEDRAVLREIETLMSAEAGMTASERLVTLVTLVTLVEAYERHVLGSGDEKTEEALVRLRDFERTGEGVPLDEMLAYL